MNLVWRPRALADLRRIYAYVARHSDPTHAYEVLGTLHPQINDVAHHPDKGRRGHRRNERSFVALAFGQTYRCIYLRYRDRIVIKRVIDTRMKDAADV